MLLETSKLRKMTIEDINDLYRGAIPHKCKDDDAFFKGVKIICNKLDIQLTQEQHNILLAVVSRQHPIIVDSCPGSGKTMLAQVITLVEEFLLGIPPLRILNITYSTQAAGDMKVRHETFCKQFSVQSLVEMRTMHSFYNTYIEKYHTKLGLMSYSAKDNLLSTEEIYNTLSLIYTDVFKTSFVSNDVLNNIFNVMNYVRDSCIPDYEIPNLRSFKELNIDIEAFKKMMRAYKLNKEISMPTKLDYGDMQELFLKLLRENADIKSKIQLAYKRIIVDEYQDTSKIQFEILKEMVGDPACLFAVGDKDQSIYSWRGANPTSYEDLQKYYSSTELHTMGVNMRCPEIIVRHASDLISYNPNRNEKHMVSTGKEGTIRSFRCKSNYMASKVIADQVEKDFEEHGLEGIKNHAVLYRAHSQSMFLIDMLLKKNIPINVNNTKLPYDDKITRDFMNIYYMLESPDNPDFAADCMYKICGSFTARSKNIIKKAMNGFTTILELGHLANNQDRWQEDRKVLVELIDMVKNDKSVGEISVVLLKAYYNNYYEFVARKTGVLMEHINAVFNYLWIQKSSFEDFMREILQIQAKLNGYKRVGTGITLGTMHGAKGLEYTKVYLLNISDRLSPDEKQVKDLDKVEAIKYLIEEMNLVYVAMTRAKKDLVITYDESNVSRFLYYGRLMSQNALDEFKSSKPYLCEPIDMLDIDSEIDYLTGNSIVTKSNKPLNKHEEPTDKIVDKFLSMLDDVTFDGIL